MNKTYIDQSVAIIGIGCRFPGGIKDTVSFWDFLVKKKNGCIPVPKDRWRADYFYNPNRTRKGKIYARRFGFLKDIDQFDPQFFNMSPREAESMDPQHRLLLEVTWEAIEDSGIIPSHLSNAKVGVFVGQFMADYGTLQVDSISNAYLNLQNATGVANSMSSNRLSYFFNLTGPSMTIDTACSSGLVSIDLACKSLLMGETKLSIAGGVNAIIKPESTISISQASMLSPDGYCKSFDAKADGYARAEGAGILVLKRLSEAIKDNDLIYAVIRGIGINQDGKTDSITIPNGDAQVTLATEVLATGRINPQEISYAEAHGTGTPTGDPIETKALGTFLSKNREKPCPIGSVKSNFGHTESAAGVASVIKIALMMQHKKIPANLHFKTPNPNIPFDTLKLRVPTKLEAWHPIGETRKACVNSFGFGGTNAHAILEEYNDTKENKHVEKDQYFPIALSARSKASLSAYVKKFITYIKENPELNLAELSYTSVLRREQHHHRFTTAAKEKTVLIEQLQAHVSDTEKLPNATVSHRSDNSLVWVFSGMGQQWWAMGRQLLTEEPIVQETVKEISTLFSQHTQSWELYDELTKDETTSRINATEIAQPCIFALQVALARLWQARGVQPDIVMGHSVGEVSTAYIGGALSLADAVKVSYIRSQLQHTTEGTGTMLAVGLSEEHVICDIEPYKEKVAIAAINSPNAVTLSGDQIALEMLASMYTENTVFNRFLKVNVPYHSPGMDDILKELAIQLADIKPQNSHIPIISTVTGEIINGENLDAIYWCNNVRQTVRFHKGVTAALQQNAHTFLEIGAHPVLSTSIKETADAVKTKLVILPSLRRPSLRRKAGEYEQLNFSLGMLHCVGVDIEWQSYFLGHEQFVRFPTYAWDKKRYWNESPESIAHRCGSDSPYHPLIGERLATSGFLYQGRIDTGDCPYLVDHQVKGSIVLPAAAYLEMMLSTANHYTNKPFVLENIQIKAPLVLDENIWTNSQVRLETSQQKLTVHSAKEDKKNKWQLHAQGQLSFTQEIQPDALDISAIKKRCPRTISREAAYEHFGALDLNYGPQFQMNNHLWIGEDEVLSELYIPANISGQQLSDYCLHPAIIDNGFQTLLILINSGTYLPVFIQSIHIFNQLSVAVYVYAKRLSYSDRYIRGDFTFVDEAGKILVKINGLSCQYVEGSHKQQADLSQLFFNYYWIETPLGRIDERHSLPSPQDLVRKCQARLESLSHLKIDDFYQSLSKKIQQLCAGFTLDIFNRLGFPLQLNSIFTKTELIQKTKIINSYHPLVYLLLTRLVESAILVKIELETYKVVKLPDQGANHMWQQLIEDFPRYLSDLRLIKKAADHYHYLLTGKESAHHVFFSGNDLLKNFYQTSPYFNIYNHMTAQVIHEVINNIPKERPLRILEIGAGTGGLTTYVLPILPGHRAEYVFTDISPAFLDQAAEKFRTYTNVTYHVLNIENDIQEQNFKPNEFDIILSANAIHATTNLRSVMTHIQTLLKPDGLLILLESTQVDSWLEFVFGLFDGWWLFEDKDLRQRGPILTPNKWQHLLQEACFSETSFLLDNGSASTHSVLVAKSSKKIIISDTIVKKKQKKTYLLLCDAFGIASQLRTLLHQNHVTVIDVIKGNRFKELSPTSYQVDPSDPNQLLQIPACQNLNQPPIVIDMWHITDDTNMPTVANENSIELLHVIQTLTAVNWHASLDFYLVGIAVHSVGNIRPMVSQAALWGIGRTLMNEHPHIQTRLIDLAPDIQDGDLKNFVIELLQNNPDDQKTDDEIAFRNGYRYVQRLFPLDRSQFEQAKTARFSLQKKNTAADKSDLIIFETAHADLNAHDIEIEVKTTGLNPRDVAQAFGGLDYLEKTYGHINDGFGLECAGIVNRVGDQVTQFKVGDAVMGFAINSLASHTVTQDTYVAHKPGHISFEEAATIPLAFTVAYFALVERARLKSGDHVLIHDATSSIGLAAIQIARSVSATIYVTGINDEKCAFLQGLNLHYIGNLQTPHWQQDLKVQLHDKMIDIILSNLLDPVIVRESLSLLTPSTGHYLDLVHTHQENTLDLQHINKGISLSCINLENIIRTQPGYFKRLFDQVMCAIKDKQYKPIAYQIYTLGAINTVFKSIKNHSDIGKTIVTIQDSYVNPIPQLSQYPFPSSGSCLIAGGLGGFGLATAEWLAGCGVKDFILVGRGGISNTQTQEKIACLQNKGCNITVYKGDVAQLRDIQAIVSKIKSDHLPLKIVIHAAMVLDDIYLSNMTEEQMTKSLAPKAYGAWYLHEATKDLNLDYFLCFSSIAATTGNSAQGNYNAGNYILDQLIQMRRKQKLPGLSIAWGAIADVGYVGSSQAVKAHIKLMGISEISLNQTQQSLCYALQSNLSHLAVAGIDYKILAQSLPAIEFSHRFNTVYTISCNQSKENNISEENRGELDLTQVENREAILLEIVQKVASVVLKENLETIKPDSILSLLGLDSLLAVELVLKVKNMTGIELPRMALLSDELSILDIVELLEKELINRCESKEIETTPSYLVKSTPSIQQPKTRLFCFPYFAGSASNFNTWQSDIGADIEVIAIQLPGRDQLSALTQHDPTQLIYALATEIQAYIDLPFACYGHSMGGLLAFQVCAHLIQNNIYPLHLFIGASAYPSADTPIRKLLSTALSSDKQMISKLLAILGLDTVYTQENGLLDQMMPALTCDMWLLIHLLHKQNWQPLNCPMTAFGGSNDGVLTAAAIQKWQQLAHASFDFKEIDGHHLFMDEEAGRKSLISHINAVLDYSKSDAN